MRGMKKITSREFWLGFFRNVFALALGLFIVAFILNLLGLLPDGIRRN
jgi:hypothetical protein